MSLRSVRTLAAAGLLALLLVAGTAAITRDLTLRLTISPAWAVAWLLGAGLLGLGLWLRRRDRRETAALTGRDLTEHAVHEARTQARTQAELERTRLISRIDHELKNPVMALGLARATLADAGSPEGDRDRALAVVGQQTERLAGLLGGLRKVADLEHRSLDREDVDLAEVLVDVHAQLADTEAGRQREWSLLIPKAPWPVPRVYADPDLLFLAVHNLADNAVKYTRPGDHISLRIAEDPEGPGGPDGPGCPVLIEVADTGAGIPDDEVAGVWEEMSRASTAQGIAGQGLGLPLVRSVARRHGGRVHLRSRVGEGTVVRMWLPIGTAGR